MSIDLQQAVLLEHTITKRPWYARSRQKHRVLRAPKPGTIVPQEVAVFLSSVSVRAIQEGGRYAGNLVVALKNVTWRCPGWRRSTYYRGKTRTISKIYRLYSQHRYPASYDTTHFATKRSIFHLGSSEPQLIRPEPHHPRADPHSLALVLNGKTITPFVMLGCTTFGDSARQVWLIGRQEWPRTRCCCCCCCFRIFPSKQLS